MTTETATPNQADASTAFLRAARAGQIEKIINLLEQGVDINISNANGLNAIHLASKDGHVEVVRELLERGAAIDAATKKGNTALHIASLAGQEQVVKLLVQNGAQVNIQSQNGFTPLYMAAQENHDGVVKFLLANGANQSLATEDGFTPLAVAMQQGHEKVVAVLLEADTRGRVRLPALHIAAKKDDVKAANLLLENEHNPDVTSKSGFTPLHIAAHYGNEGVARLLLAKGADVNCAAKHNICPLHVAAKWGKDNMVALLCDNGANVEARTRDGLTPLHCAARSGHERVVEALLDRGAPITSKSKNGLAPLHMAAQGDHSEAARVLLSRRAPVDDVTVDYLTALHVAAHCGHAKVAKLLLDRNADANARALNGFTPLHIACKKNRIKVVELLLKYGASIQATTESGLTPLHVASFMGCMNIVIYLLQHEANPDVPTVRGETPLHLAARANQTDIIRILLRNGAAVEAKARERQTPLHIASRLGNVDIAVLLLQHGADVRAHTADHYNALHIAAKQHNHDVASALIEHNAPLTATTKKGFTALHLAAKYGNLKVANLLLAHGASPDQAGKNGMTPLHVAAQYDQHAVANTLLEKGADAKAIAKNGHTPLHIAARKNQMETAATLLEHGALTNAESKAGFTPLHLAAQQGHTEMCSLLLEHDADVDQQAKNGLAALHLASQEDRVPVAQLLVKNGAELDICTKGGYTPLHIASHYGQINMVRYLLESGASVKAQTSHGYTALHHAAQQGHINIVNILLEYKADANATTVNGQTPLDIASKLGYVTVMETLKEVSEPSLSAAADKYKVVAPETMLETFMSDSEEEGGEDAILNDQPYRYLTADDMKSLGDDSLPIDVTKDERTESAMSHKNVMEISQGSVNGMPYQPHQEVVVKSISRYNTAAPEGYCYNVDPTQPKKKLQWKNFLVSFLVDARGGALRGNRGGGVRVIVPPLSAQQPTRITCRYLKPSRINHMPPLMEGEALAARVLEMGPVSAKFLGPVILEVPHYASLRGKEREIVILRSDNGTSWREHSADATDDMVQDILHETLEIEETSEEDKGWDAPRVTRILTHDFPQYFAVISRIRQEVHAIGPEGGMVSSSVVPQVQAVFPQGALTKKIKVGLQAQIIDSELTAKLLGRGVAVSPVVTVEPRRRKFHKAITLSMPAPRPHTQGMTNQYSTSSAPTLRLLCSISGGTNRAHWEDVTENTPLTFVNDCVSFTTTVSARYWLIDCRHVEEATKMATELYREAIHVPFMARFVVYAKRTDECQAQLRMFCVTDDKEDKALERIERFIQVAKSRDVEVHEGKPVYLEFGGNLVPVAKSGEQISIPFRAFRENRVAFPVMIKTQDLEPICRCQFMRDPKVPKGEPSPTPIAVLNIMVPDDLPVERTSPLPADLVPRRTEEQELIWRQRLSDPRLGDICNLLGKDWVALAYELGVSVATVNQIQAKRISTAEQAQLMLKLWKTQSGTKAQDNSLELALCRIGRDDIIAPQSELTNERRIQRNIYQDRQASEEIEAYKAEEDNKLKDSIYDDSEIEETTRTEDLDQDEAKYSPEEKSVEKSEMDRTPTPSEESEEDEDVKRSVAERKEQITKKLSCSKIPSSKQKKELREEIIEIKTQIKPDIKKFQDIEQQARAETKLEIVRPKSSPSPERVDVDGEKEIEVRKETIKEKKEELKQERPVEQFRKFDPSSPGKPTPKHLQRHMRNESMRFPSGDFSNVTITPRKSITVETSDPRHTTAETKTESFTKEVISQKEIDSARLEEKLDDGNRSPELVTEDAKDMAEAPLKDKINAFEIKISKEPTIEPTKTIKLTKEALKRHTQEQDQALEYTQAFVRDQSKQISSTETQIIVIETDKDIGTVKSVKETIQHFDSKIKLDDKPKQFPKAMRTDSTLVQVSSEEDSEFLKKSTDSETETESQTTVKVEKDKKSKFEMTKHSFETRTGIKDSFDLKPKGSEKAIKKDDDGDKKDDQAVIIKEQKLEKQLTDELRLRVSEEEISEALEEKDVSVDDRNKEKIETQHSIASTKSDVSKHTKTDSVGSDVQDVPGRKISQESPLPSGIDKTDSFADLQQSTEKDVSFVSQTESKIYSKESKHRSDSLDEASQFSDLDDQMGLSPAHRPTDKQINEEKIVETEEKLTRIAEETRRETLEFLKYESEHSAQVHVTPLTAKDSEKVVTKESPVISAKARQFIETVPEDDSVQECFFSKRIYSDSLEDSDHTDSRRHSEADSLKSDQSDIKAKISSSDFDERAEYEGTADSGSGFGDEKFEESIGFTAIKIDTQVLESQKQDSDSTSTQIDEAEIIFKKMAPKRHSRTESVSITKLSDLADIKVPAKQEFQMFVTEAEDLDRSFDKDEPSDKISSESSREIEISDRKSSEGISDRISSEDAVTDKKTSSEEEPLKEDHVFDKEKATEPIKSIKEKEVEGIDTMYKGVTLDKGNTLYKVEPDKRQSVTSVGSGSVGELRLDEKRLSDAYSLTESRDYTFEESEDDIGTHGTHVDIIKEKVENKQEIEERPKSPSKVTEPGKIAKLTHGDSLDDVEGFPEDHVTDYVHKLPHIAEVSFMPDKEIAGQFLLREREEQLKREFASETILSKYAMQLKEDDSTLSQPQEAVAMQKEAVQTSIQPKEIVDVKLEHDKKKTCEDKITMSTEYKSGESGEKITITTVTNLSEGPSGEEIIRTTVTETTKYPSGRETVSTKVSESIRLHKKESIVTSSNETTEPLEGESKIHSEVETKEKIEEDIITLEPDEKLSEEIKTTPSTEHKTGVSGEKITITTDTDKSYGPSGEEIVRTTVTETAKYPSGRETVSTKVSENIISHKKEAIVTHLVESSEPLKDEINYKAEGKRDENVEKDDTITCKTETIEGKMGEKISITTRTEVTNTPSGDEITKTTVTETTTFPTGEVKTSTRVSESIKTAEKSQVLKDIKLSKDKKDEISSEDSTTTKIDTVIGPAGEEITIETVTDTSVMPTGEKIIKTTVTETTKYPSGKITISKKISEQIESIEEEEEIITTKTSEVADHSLEERLQNMLMKTDELADETHMKTSSTTKTITGPGGEEITSTTVTEETEAPTGEVKVKTTVTEVTKYPSGEESISTKVSETVKCFESHISTIKESRLVKGDVIFSSKTSEPAIIKEKLSNIMDPSQVCETEEGRFIPDSNKVVPIDKQVTKTEISKSDLGVTKVKVHDTVNDIDDTEDVEESLSKELILKDAQVITKEQVKPVIDDILQEGTIVAAARSPVKDKDLKTINKEIVETEMRFYDAKVPQKEERRHSCIISPAVSLERIAESEREMEEDIAKKDISHPPKEKEIKQELKKSDSAMKQMADNIEIIIKQASEDLDISDEFVLDETKTKELDGEVSVDSIIEEAVHTVEGYLEKSVDAKTEDVEITKESGTFEDTKTSKERPGLMKSLSRDSGEIVIMPKKKQVRTFSVQSSPDEVEEQIYTDSESDMDKAKVLEIIEPSSDVDGKIPTSSFDIKKIRTDSLDDADDFPEKEAEFFEDDGKYAEGSESLVSDFRQEAVQDSAPSSSAPLEFENNIMGDKLTKKTHFVDSILRTDLASKSTTESSVTTVISTLTKSSDDDQKSVVEDGTSADLSKISGADLVKDPSKTSIDTKEDFRIDDQIEDRGTPDLSKKSIDLTKDYSKSSIDSKDTSRDFATNELSKDSTVDLTKDFSKASIESVKEISRSMDEKTFSEEHSSLDFSKTLASDVSEEITRSKDFAEEDKSTSKRIHISTSSSQETSVMTESKLFSDNDEKSFEKVKVSEIDIVGIKDQLLKEIRDKGESLKDDLLATDTKKTILDDKKEDAEIDDEVEKSEKDDEVPDMKELNRRCSNLLDDISSQGALIRIDSSHVTHDLSSKFSITPPPSPVDLIMKERAKSDDSATDKQSGLQPKGSDSSFLDPSRTSPRASSAGDSTSILSETEAHQSELLTEASKALSEAARPKSPTKHVADNLSFVNVDKPTITSGAIELVDRTIEKSIDVIDQIKKEMEDEVLKSTSTDTFYSESRIETSTSSSSVHKTIEGSQLKFQNIDPEAVMTDMIAKFGTSSEYCTVLSHKETETRKISGQEYFTETKQVSSSDDDSLIIKTEMSHELRGQEHQVKEKMVVKREGDQTKTSQKKMEKAHEATAKRSDVETKTVFKSTDDTDIVKVEREFSEKGLYTGRQTKSEERMTALKDEIVKKKHEVKISERDLSHEQWGKEYFTEPEELEDIKEDDDTKSRIAFVDSSLKIVEKDETVSSIEVSEKGLVVSSKIEHFKEESVIESKEHDDLSSDASHVPSFKSETAERRDSSEASPKSKSKSFKKDDEVYEVDFIKEIKISTSPIKSTFSRTGSQDTHSESEVVPELPNDDKISDTPKKENNSKSPIKLPLNQSEDLILEVSVCKGGSSVIEDLSQPTIPESESLIKSTMVIDTTDESLELKEVAEDKVDAISTKPLKVGDVSPNTIEISDDISTISRDVMIKSGGSVDTEYMVKSLESHESEVLQKSMDSTVSAETLQASEFSTEADSAFLTGTDQKKEEIKLVKEKSTEDVCSSGYDTDFSSAEFHGMKLESERVTLDSLISTQPLADLSVLEKTIDEVKQSLEAAQGEIISEKSDGSIKYKQSPSEFQFKLLISPERPEVIKEEPHHIDDHSEKVISDKEEKIMDSQKSDNVSQIVSSHEETTLSDEDRETVHQKESSPPLETDISIRSDSGPHSILDTESDIISFDKNGSSKGSPEVKLRAHKHIKSQLGIVERRSASDIECWSSSGESHYHSFEHSESRPLSSDVEVMMTAQSGTEYETALTSHDVSSQSLRTSKDYYTAGSSLASRDSMRSLDSDASSHVASIDISDASETLVPSANELKEELMESSTYVEQFLHEPEKGQVLKVKEVSDEEISGEDDEYNKADNVEPVGKMKRSHEMRFQPKEMIPEHFPLEGTSESIELDDDSLKDKEGSDTTISSQFKTEEILSSSISKLDVSSSQSQLDSDKEEVQEIISKAPMHTEYAIPFSVTKIDKPQREFVDVESEIIPVGSAEYEEIQKTGSITTTTTKLALADSSIVKTVIKDEESIPKSKVIEPLQEVKEECVKKVIEEISTIPFPITERPPSQREFVDIEDDIIPVGTKQYEEILKSKSDSSVPKTKAEKSGLKNLEDHLESKQSSTSSLKTHEHLSTPHTPLSAPSQSSLSTDNGREYVLDDMYDISETPELKSELMTENSKSELVVTTEEKTLHTYEKEQESPTSDEFEMVDKPSEMDDFVVIEEVAKEAQETDPEGKSLKITTQKYVKRHDIEVEEYLSKTSKKQESTSSASGSLSDEEQYELEQKRLQAQELAEIEAGKRWIQMQFEGDPRYDYERIPLEDIKEEEMTDFDASRIGSLSSQKESIGSYGSFRNSYGSLSESEMASRMRFRIKGENDDISISSLQEFENLERALMEQYQQHSSSSQDSLNGSLPRRYILSKSQGDDISISSLKEFEGLETACLEALKAELLAKQKEALLLADPKVVSGSFLEQEKRSYDSSSESSPPFKSGSPGQKSGSPSQKGGSPSQKIGSYGSPSQKFLADSVAIRKIIDQQLALEQRIQEYRPKIITVKKFDDKGAFFVPEPEPGTSEPKTCEVVEECQKASSFVCAAAPSDGSAESIPGDCEEMMKILDQEEKSKKQEDQGIQTESDGVKVQTTTIVEQKFIDGKKVSETFSSVDNEQGIDIPARSHLFEESTMSLGSEMSSSLASQPSELDSLMTIIERHPSDSEVVSFSKHTVITTERYEDKPEDLEFSREGSAIRELSPSSGRSMAHSIISGKHFTDPASGSWSGQDEELSSSGSFSRARADMMLGSTDSLEATSSNATRATYNYEVDTPMTGSLTSGGSNTMVSSLDTLDAVTAVQMESLEHQSTSEHCSQDYEVQEPDSDTERLELDSRIPRAKERTIMFDSTDTLSAVSGDNSVRDATVEAPAPTFYIGDTPILKGEKKDDEENEPPTLSGSCPASLPPTTQPSQPIPAQRRSLSMIPKPTRSSLDVSKK